MVTGRVFAPSPVLLNMEKNMDFYNEKAFLLDNVEKEGQNVRKHN